MKWFTGIMVGVLTVYLHILAVRTGLLALYVFITLFAVYIGVSRNKHLGIGMMIFIFLFGAFAYNYSPTLKKKINYFAYTIGEYNRSGLQGHYSDMGRLISYDVAFKKIKQHALYGVGAGDVLSEMNVGYDTWYPDVEANKRLVPHNQFMVVALACGIPVLTIFVLWVIMPLMQLKKNRSGFFFFAVWVVLLIPLMVEPMLEVQFGVFVYLFFLLWQKHAVLHEQDNE
jgi:O-antigen ligase